MKARDALSMSISASGGVERVQACRKKGTAEKEDEDTKQKEKEHPEETDEH